LSVKAGIVCWIVKEIVLGLDEKNSIKNGQDIEFEFYVQKMAKNSPFGA
jgi:hypothetical protein